MELNPNHPVTATMRNHYHKLLAVIMHKYRDVLPAEIAVTAQDVEALQAAYPGSPAVLVDSRADAMRIRLVDEFTARRLAKEVEERLKAAGNVAPDRCPTCSSPAPSLHPAGGLDGEIVTCPDEWHAQPMKPRT